ncbi:hypothetical protein QVD17_32941 [Tagetes erecta]|uniref:Uncharacterized protein n=1 Tax=Tagetes erecta TaxID=13708 RepID=A0AAD8K2N0_TARER|nr:hypothetical protein QVD17_32941 [Tagetes erecta]
MNVFLTCMGGSFSLSINYHHISCFLHTQISYEIHYKTNKPAFRNTKHPHYLNSKEQRSSDFCFKGTICSEDQSHLA